MKKILFLLVIIIPSLSLSVKRITQMIPERKVQKLRVQQPEPLFSSQTATLRRWFLIMS